MGIELLEIGVKLRKGVIFTIRGCFRSVYNHPFLVGFVCFLILLYRSSPFIFSLLVSTSPILVCTAVLLGVLLSYGEPNIPEIEIEEKTTFGAVSLKAGVVSEDVVETHEKNYYAERFSENEIERSTEQLDLSAVGEVRSGDAVPLIEERSGEVESNDGEIRQNNEWIDEKLKDDVLESDDEKSEADSFGSQKVNVDSPPRSPPRSPWARVEEREREEEEGEDEDGDDDDDSDSGSDGAESSSPDASMADIMPMLDELHPLLDDDDEAPQDVHISSDDDVASSEKSSKSSNKSHDSDDEDKNHDDLLVADDENEDKEEESKSAITWTEEDQKNLMDLGSSEIERNQRLENLILRRRARKNMSKYPENLIDLESFDFPSNLAPISTRRQNPFDDSYDNLGLPPIPGSAPSILLPRRNPFDIPYDSSEEKPDLMGDGFKEEFKTFQSRDPIFRRHESFNVGHSRMRPYFVPEGTLSEESSYSSFQRQLSELSESKVSSVLETESIGSVEDLEDRKISEEDDRQEDESSPWPREVFEGPSENPELIPELEEVNEVENVHKKPEPISEMECDFEHVGHGSQSSEDEKESVELEKVEKRELQVDEREFHLESVTREVEIQATEYRSNYEGVEKVYTRDSSSSSLSEVSERVFTETEVEGLPTMEEIRDGVVEQPRILTQTSTESINMSISNTLVIEVPQRAPVYDSSPREIVNNISSSSVSSLEILPETSITHTAVESRPVDVVDTCEHEKVNTDDFSEDEKEYEREVLSAYSYNILKSSVEASVVENIVEEHGLGEVYGLIADENIQNLEKFSEDRNLENFIEEHGLGEFSGSRADLGESSEDQNLDQLHEDKFPLIEVISDPSSESQLREEHTIGREESVRSPISEFDAYSGAEGNTYLGYDVATHEPSSTHLNNVQESSAPVQSSGDVQITQNLNMPEVEELDREISSYIDSPLSPEFISVATETTDSHANVETITEEVDDIKEIDEELLSELDNVGDFSLRQWESGSSEFEKRIDSVEESFVETSSTRVADVNLVEENKIENVVHSEKSREDTDKNEEVIEYISEPQSSKTNRAEHIDVSKMEFNEDETLSKENEVQSNFEDNISEVLESEVRSKEKQTTVVDAEVSYEMAEFEATKIEDIHVAFKDITAKDMEKPVVMEAHQAEPIVEETLVEHSKNGALDQNSSVMGSTQETLVLEVKPIVDTTLDSQQSMDSEKVPLEDTILPRNDRVLDGESMKEVKLNSDDGSMEIKTEEVYISEPQSSKTTGGELIDVEFNEDETLSKENEVQQDSSVVSHNFEDFIFEKPELEGRSKENETTVVDAELSYEMAEFEARKIEDINVAFEKITAKDMEKPVVLEPPQAETVVEEILAKHCMNDENSSLMGSTHERSVLEVRPTEETTLDSKLSNNSEKLLSEGAILPPNDRVLDGESMEQLKLNSDDGSVEVKAGEVGPSVVELKVQEASVVADKPDHEIKATKDVHLTSGKGKDKNSSSSSSSSSESSSSDSDKE